jgi:hypothetical protein
VRPRIPELLCGSVALIAFPLRPSAAYVGGMARAACHTKVAEAWRDSLHGRAMQIARDRTALGTPISARQSISLD